MAESQHVKNAASRKQVKQADESAKAKGDDHLNDLRKVLATDHGRRVIWYYLSHCGVFRPSFDGSSKTFFREGERNVGLFILSEINQASPATLIEMMQECGIPKND